MKTKNKIHSIEAAQKPEAAPSVRCRTGKIARLPLAVREPLNQRMLDGQEGKALVEWLNSLPEVQAILAAQFQGRPIREQNLSEWRKGGHQTWKAEKNTQQKLTSLLEKISGLEGVAKDGLTHKLAFYLTTRIAMELQRLELAPDGAEKAKAMRELTANLVALRRGDLELERLRLQREKYGLRQKTEEERVEEFWQWAEKDINRDEFCRRRCYTAEEREAAIDKILGITPAERGETVHPDADAASVEAAPAQSGPIRSNPAQSD
jgi:hypothetical protein